MTRISRAKHLAAGDSVAAQVPTRAASNYTIRSGRHHHTWLHFHEVLVGTYQPRPPLF